MMYREDGASVFEQATGHSPNPDRKSNARKRRERMKVIGGDKKQTLKRERVNEEMKEEGIKKEGRIRELIKS